MSGPSERETETATETAARGDERHDDWYRKLVEEATDITVVLDSNGTMTYVSPAVKRLLGYTPTDMIGEDGHEYVHPEDGDDVSDAIQKLREPPMDPETVEFRCRHDDGTWRWLEVTMRNRLDGEIGGIIVNGRDITERKERETELQTTKERMTMALEGANLGIWDWDMVTDEVARDELLTQMLGYERSEMGDHLEGWEQVVHPDGKKRHDEALAEHIEERTPYYQCEYRLKTKSGDWKWVRTMGKVVERDESGEPVRAVGIHQDIDDRKRAELELKSERDMFKNGPAVVFKWVDAEGWPITYVSKNVERVFGYTPAELQEHEFEYGDLVHSGDLDRIEQEMSAYVDEETDLFNPEPYRVTTAEGDVRWVAEYTKTLQEDGDRNHLIGYIVDITERKRRERQLEAREEKYRSLFENTRDALMLMDRDGYLDCNHRALELFGVDSVEEFLRYSPWEFSPQTQPDGSDSKEGALDWIDEAFEEGEAFFEWTHQRIDGTNFPAEVKLSRFEYDGDYIIHALVRDITERKEQKQELAAERNRIRAITNAIPDVTVVYDREGRYREILTGREDLLPADPSELTGSKATDVLPPDVAGTIVESLKASLDTGAVQTVEYSLDLEGESTWFEGRIAPIPDEGHDEVVLLARDTTERKEYEQQLEEQRDNLDILNQVLRHDIRNDIQLITAYAELLEAEADEEEFAEYIETILENANHVIELTKSAREVADVMQSAEKELKQVGLRTVLSNEIEEVRAAYPEADVVEATAIPQVTVQANDMLESVFRNLLKNAIQHNDTETPRVAVSVTDRDETVHIRVADNGPGVPDEQKERIFGKGKKGLDSQGTGIGLYLVKTLVGNYSGDIWVEDRDEQGLSDSQAIPDDEREGAVFVVELPKVKLE
ncbi:multi-sensor signal transduction histidine kinase [Halanaeroarchaeum sulfurireducens]|uniref:histidine kinase n=2 Tax=Halanaeroarchaeum sulfurireducens TaxID=1604004 RepID=A0A0F7PBJ0_9EURY|nr:multi-sensor signal transduction histidine kinase [Halanaeroarchaeum sulfurireducens]ALG81921.1 multi-sensor signal transduction histidine kinase [Halanaeroarchaeum sulfurireducens]